MMGRGFSRKTLIRALFGISILVLLTAGASNGLFSPNSPLLAAPANAPFDHVVIIILENHGLNQIYGSSSAPYLTGLANTWSLSQHYTAVDHPSEPNYLAMGSGLAGDCGSPAPNTGGCLSGGGDSTSDSGPTAPGGSYSSNALNMVDRLETSGLTWDAYLEGSSGSCDNSFGTAYHAWFLFYDDIVSNTSRCNHIHSFATTSPTNLVTELNSGSSASLIWINPDNSHNMHDNSVSSGDTYMSTLIPQILSSTEFTTTKALLLVTFDEGSSSYPSDYVYTVFAGPAAKTAYKSTTNYTHYSILKTLETSWGIQSLQSTDADAAAMTEFFAPVGPVPLSTGFTVSASPTVNLPVTFTATTVGGIAPYTIAWNFGDGSTGTGASITHTYSSAQAFIVAETATDSSSPTQTSTSSKSVPVSVPPPLTTGFTVSPSSPVVNTAVTFTAATTSGTAPYTTSWDFGDSSTGTGTVTTHTYATAQSYTVTETSKDSSTPQQTAVSTQTVTVSTTLAGNFGVCTSLPQGWGCGNTNGLTGSSVNIVNGVLETRESNPGVGNDNSYYYATSQKGTFPWSPCQAPASGVLPTGLASVSTTFTPITITASGSYRYHIYVALYYWLPNGAVRAGGSNYQCLDTQVRIENINGVFTQVGSTATYNPGDSFGWDQITIGSVTAGSTYTLTANVQQQCQSDEAAWGIPTTTPCQIAGLEIGTEGFQFQQLDVNWFNVSLNTTTPPPNLAASINYTPSSPVAGQSISFSGSATGGTSPYTYSWTFGDGGTATGPSVTHAYATAGSYTIQLTVKDNTGVTASIFQTVTVAPQPPSPLQASFTFIPTSVQVGQTVAFTGTAAGGTQPYSYSWTFGDGTTGSGAAVTHAYSTAGSFTVTLTVADSASQTSSSSNTIAVSPLPIPDFTINASPTTLSVQVGNSATTQIQLVSLNGFSGTVLLTATVSPTGPTVTFTQASLNLGSGGSASSPLTIVTSTSTPVGIYDVSINAVSGSTAHTIHVTLSVTAIPPPPDFAMSVSQSTLTIQAGRTKNTLVTVTSLNGFSGTVLLTATSSSGLNFSLTQGALTLSSGSAQTLTLTVGVLPTTLAGAYNITLSAASSSLQHSTTLTIKATHNNRPSIKVPGPKIALVGSSIQFVVNATDPDQGETLTLSVTGLPPGASFDPTTGLFYWTPLQGQWGTYSVTFTATDNGYPVMWDSNFVIITVQAPQPPPPPTQNQGTCLLCQITQTAKTNSWLLVASVLAGFMLTLTVVYLRARGRLQEVRRMRRLTRYS